MPKNDDDAADDDDDLSLESCCTDIEIISVIKS